MQLGLGFNNPNAVQVERYHMVLQFTGENTVAKAMMQEATVGTWLNKSDHPHFFDWGTLRTDLDFLGPRMKTKLCLQSADSNMEVSSQYVSQSKGLWPHR